MKAIKLLLTALLLASALTLAARPINDARLPGRIYLDSRDGHGAQQQWRMMKAHDVKAAAEEISSTGYDARQWMPAVVPGTVLRSLVYNKVYPNPYFALNNKLEKGIIPDISRTGRDFYTYWFRTELTVPQSYKGKTVWMQLDGINYRAEVWLNGHLVAGMAGMFRPATVNITDFARPGLQNVLAVKVMPVDMPGTTMPKSWGAAGEWHNGGDGNIGLNTTMLMSVGWDFTLNDGIRDRNTGIWKSISLFATGDVRLQHPFVRSKLNHDYTRAEETVSVELCNATSHSVKCEVEGTIGGTGICFRKKVDLFRGETATVEFTPADYRQLAIGNPRLWWPLNKGEQNLYDLKLVARVGGQVADSTTTRFGIREITSDQNTPDRSRQFYVNGRRLFVRGTNWIPEAMLLQDDDRTYAELRYTRQAGINFIRLWGGGIAESDYFYQLCDEMGLLVWQEFWMTGDTRHPHDADLYLANVQATVKRLRNHPSLAYYVSSNESTEMPGARSLIMQLDGTRGYQMASEVDGIHDGSPYKQVNPMQHYENTASDRGSRVDGFNPEYGAPTLPLVESLRRMMPERDLWPINKEVWDYLDGGGFHLMSTLYKDLTDQYGTSASIDEYARKAQLVGAMNSKSIWEVWNENKLDYGDRYASGLLFWYHNSPVYQVAGRMWDYFLQPTASLYHTQNALQPLHPQFDYLTNTVSVVNDYYKACTGYTVEAAVYDLDSRLVWKRSTKVDLPADGVANDVLRIGFPDDITQVHFIKLRLTDERGRVVGDNFYWRSRDAYKGKGTLTGPCTSGFASLAQLPGVKIRPELKVLPVQGTTYAVTLHNRTPHIAFFAQLQVLDAQQQPIAPCFFADNFFSLLPGERRTVTIEVPATTPPAYIKLKGWNIEAAVVKTK